MDGQLDIHFISKLEQKFEKSRFVRVDSDIAENLIQKEDRSKTDISSEKQNALSGGNFASQTPKPTKQTSS